MDWAGGRMQSLLGLLPGASPEDAARKAGSAANTFITTTDGVKVWGHISCRRIRCSAC